MADKFETVGILIGGFNTYFPKELMRGIIARSRERNINTIFFLGIQTANFYKEHLDLETAESYDYQFNTIYDYSLLGGLDGLIINYGTIGSYLKDRNPLHFAQRFDIPAKVFMTEIVDQPGTISVISDNYQGMYDVVSHLIEVHGCKKILHLTGPLGNRDGNERKEGYLAALRDHGLTVEDSMIAAGTFSEFDTPQLEELLNGNPDADAIACANDEEAIAAYKVCKKHGLQVGRDILITGFDDCLVAGDMQPPLTTLFQDGRKMGARSLEYAESLIRRCREGKNAGEESGCALCQLPPETVREKTSLIIRESCGCQPKKRSGRFSLTHLETDLKEANEMIASLQQANVDEQRKSWFIPFFSRELDEKAGNDREFSRRIVEGMDQCHAGDSFLFLLDHPVRVEDDEKFVLPEDLRLAAYSRAGEQFAYEVYERPLVSKEQGIAQLMNCEEIGSYMVFLLFSGPIQYGLLACEVNAEEFSFVYMLSLQLGNSLRYHELRKVEMSYRGKLLQDMEKIRKINHELDIASEYDPLTGLLNRRGFFHRSEEIMEAGKVNNYLIFADLDHLKQINDGFGHKEGDYAISKIGEALRNCLREYDVVARIGGDEFVCLVPCAGDDFPNIFDKRFRAYLKRENDSSGKPYYVEASFGLCPSAAVNAQELEAELGQADSMLYEAKKHRRESVVREI